MSQPEEVAATKPNASLLIRGAIWIAIGALIAAALVCVVWVLIGDQDGLIGRAFLTILLLAGFAGIAILEAGLATNRPDWLALTSMITWIVALLVGAVKIWLPEEEGYFGVGAERFFQLVLVIGILQLALLHVRLFKPAAERYVTVFTRVIYFLTLIFLVALAGLLIFFLTFPHTFDYNDLYWRIVVALAILAAVGTTLIPLLNVLFAPKKPKAQPAAAAPQWPTYSDGGTPLPALPDGSPDWNAYYTGYPTVLAPAALPAYPAGGYAAPAIAAPAYPEPQAAPVWPVPEQVAPVWPPATQPSAPEAVAPQWPVPAAPDAPAQSGAPEVPQEPPVPGAPEVPGAPAAPAAPDAPPVPGAPAAPEAPAFAPQPPAPPAPPVPPVPPVAPQQ